MNQERIAQSCIYAETHSSKRFKLLHSIQKQGHKNGHRKCAVCIVLLTPSFGCDVRRIFYSNSNCVVKIDTQTSDVRSVQHRMEIV